jgi:hypothetical protein
MTMTLGSITQLTGIRAVPRCEDADECCGNCRWFARISEDTGLCRRYPPVPIQQNGAISSEFPVVMSESICGEFKVTQA